MKVSIIVPCYNEETNIEACLRRIPPVGDEYEILVVDDGSRDQTREQVTAAMARHPQVRLLAHGRNRGKSQAVKTGIHHATGDVVIIFDADMTIPPEELPLFVEALSHHPRALVIGTRFIYPFDPAAMRWVNRFSNRITAWLFSCFLGTRLTDTLCGTKALSMEEARQIPIGSDRWGDFDLLRGAYLRRLEIREVPIHYQPRVAGATSMKAFPDAFLLFLNCLRIGWELRVVRAFQRPPDS